MFLNYQTNFCPPDLSTERTSGIPIDYENNIKLNPGPLFTQQKKFLQNTQNHYAAAQEAELQKNYELAIDQLSWYYSHISGLFFSNLERPIEYNNDRRIVFDYESIFINERIKFTNINAERVMTLSRIYVNYYNNAMRYYTNGDMLKAKENFSKGAKVCEYIGHTLISKKIEPFIKNNPVVLPPECNSEFNMRMRQMFVALSSICIYINMNEKSKKVSNEEIKNRFNHFHHNSVELYAFICDEFPRMGYNPKPIFCVQIFLFTLQTRIISHIYESRRLYDEEDKNITTSTGILGLLKSNFTNYYDHVNHHDLNDYTKERYTDALMFLDNIVTTEYKDCLKRCEVRSMDEKNLQTYEIPPNEKNFIWKNLIVMSNPTDQPDMWAPYKPVNYPVYNLKF